MPLTAHPRSRGENGGVSPGPSGDAAHPRSRGENRLKPVRAISLSGSSPLTRGKLPKFRFGADGDKAHPRSRGENVAGFLDGGLRAGSSPLTRGKRVERREVVVRLGLIPAHAGKTPTVGKRSPVLSAHPRSRGENTAAAAKDAAANGSSPLTRGKPA